MGVTAPERDRTEAYFRKVAEPVPASSARSIVITHLLEDRPLFLAGVNRVAPVAALLPKPKSIDRGARARLDPTIPVRPLRRDILQSDGYFNALIDDYLPTQSFALLDIGGYFAPLLNSLASRYGSRFLGVVEDTENGLQKYESLSHVPSPVFSVARSPLKNPEDHLVGQSIVFSVESLLRERGAIFQGRKATVLGYGKVGRSIAFLLHARGVWTTVFDINPIRMTEAMSHGFEVPASLETALAQADLVLCATGQLSLSGDTFGLLREGAFVATVTSSDDELDLGSLRARYAEERLDNHFTRFSRPGHRFYLLNKGNAVNFLHGAVVGPFIYLVQGEILVALRNLCTGNSQPGISQLTDDDRRRIAAVWLEHFGSTVR